MINPGFWTANFLDSRQDYVRYHVYLYGSFPSSTDTSTRIVNEHLSACVDFSTNEKPYLCHRVLPSQIPKADDGTIDAGIFVVPGNFNVSAAKVCVSVDYHHMYGCGSLNENTSPFINHIFYGDMSELSG